MTESNIFYALSGAEMKLIFKWDVPNWSRALTYWQNNTRFQTLKNLSVLEVGAYDGGLSLAFALSGAQVDCTDVDQPTEKAKSLHKRFGVSGNIRYYQQNALDVFQAKYDIIVFKSVLGGIAANGQLQRAKQAVEHMQSALNDGGEIWFAENAKGSFLHAMSRSLFRKWGKAWNYLTLPEIRTFFGDGLSISTAGFLGAFGRTENQKTFLGKIDLRIERLIPLRQRYIAFGVYRQSADQLTKQPIEEPALVP